MIVTTFKTLLPEKAFRQADCFGQLAHPNQSNFLSG